MSSVITWTPKAAVPQDAFRLSLRVDRVYGNLTIYPDCERSRLLAEIAGTKSLTPAALRKIAKLGYSFRVCGSGLAEFIELIKVQS